MKTHVRKYIELTLLLLFGAMIALAQPDLTPITIYTPKHTFVEWAYTRPEEWSQQDKQGQALYYLSIYKTAMVLGEASTTYDCYGWTWYNSEGHTPNVWLIHPGLAITYARLGRMEDARKIVLAWEKASMNRYVQPDVIAAIYANMNEKEKAFQWLDKAFPAHSSGLATLRWMPEYDPLRSDPRFSAMLKKLGTEE